MEHSKKVDKAINDKNMKFVKKLLKKNPITFNSSIRSSTDCVITITNIRKYKNLWFHKDNDKFVYDIQIYKFVYEVDVIVNITYLAHSYYSNVRRLNRSVRSYRIESLIREELCYFNIEDICISKISYE